MEGRHGYITYIDDPSAVEQRAAQSRAPGLLPTYDEALRIAAQHVNGPLEHVDDWGCNSGRHILQSLARLSLHGVQVRGFDILPEYQALAALPPEIDRTNFTYIQVEPRCLDIPAKPDAADAALALNVVFRANDGAPDGAEVLIKAILQGLRPGGVGVLSSNYENHGLVRHFISWYAQQRVSMFHGQRTRPLRPPAHSMYFNDLVSLLWRLPELQVIDCRERSKHIQILPDDLERFKEAIVPEVLRTDLPQELYDVFAQYVAEVTDRLARRNQGGRLVDIVHTGMVAIRKLGKST